MLQKRKCLFLLGAISICIVSFLTSCSNKKNTSFSRFYHSVNTRYNVHFNAQESYNESLKQKENNVDESLSKMLYIYPDNSDTTEIQNSGSFTTSIDKTTKAIKLHSIKTRPKRDPKRRGDQQYQQWVTQKEFNPFLVNSWMLLAKSEFQEANYLRAITTFLYITKIYNNRPDIVAESNLWIARAYTEMGWTYEAGNVLRKMEQGSGVPSKLGGMYASVKANLLMRTGNYEASIPFLEEAIHKEKNGFLKLRKKYLLGQLYAEMDDNAKAYNAFGAVRGFSTPYLYSFNAKLRQLELSIDPNHKRISSLKGMAKSEKNKEYLDQIYFVLGNIHLDTGDTIKAIDNYNLSVKKSERNGYDKALTQIKLGGLYFDRKDYIPAQPCYSEALPQLSKYDAAYPLVSLRSEVLDKLVVHAKVVHEQDSLLLLASLPEDERTTVIQKHIDILKKEEEKKKKEEGLANQKQESQKKPTAWDDFDEAEIIKQAQAQFSGANNTGFGQQDVAEFYFYNEQTVKQGRVTFQNKWGRRPLEDNWRRMNKQSSGIFNDNFDDEVPDEALENENQDETLVGAVDKDNNKSEVTDIYSVDYYLQQLPLTDVAKEASNKLVEKGLFNMGLVYKNLLEDNTLAVDVFNETLGRYPNTENREEIYYQLFLIYLQSGNQEMMASYRNRLVNEFSESKYTVPLSEPDYAWNFKYMAKLQDSLYNETYQAYLSSDIQTVRRNYNTIQTKFPFVDLMPKFSFLNSLTYAQTKDAKSLEKNLNKLIADYPQADVTPLATNILKSIQDGKIILSDGSPIRGIDWTMAYSSDSIFDAEEGKVIEYLADLNKSHLLLLLFKNGSIDRNELLYQVADYNFSNYVVQTFDLKFETNDDLSTLEVSGFKDFKAIKSYINKGLQRDGLLRVVDDEVVAVPMSVDNYANIYPRLGIDDYRAFYADSLGTETPALLAYWGKDNAKLVAILNETNDDLLDDDFMEDESTISDDVETSEEVIVKSEYLADDKGTGIKEETKSVASDKEVNLEEVLSEEQVEFLGNVNQKADDVVESISSLGSNPVDGLKNLFNRNKFEDNLTKEEKKELKEQQKVEKARQKELKRIVKAKQDSLARVEQVRSDSILQIEINLKKSVEAEQKRLEDQLKSEQQERIQQTKDREQARKDAVKNRENERKLKEQERKEQLKNREQERKKIETQREQERKQKEKEFQEKRKEKEKQRKQLENEKSKGRKR